MQQTNFINHFLRNIRASQEPRPCWLQGKQQAASQPAEPTRTELPARELRVLQQLPLDSAVHD